MQKFTFLLVLIFTALIVISCGSSTAEHPDSAGGASGPTASSAPAAAATPAVDDEIQKAAEKSLGSETEVLLYGDLAKNGAQQVLAINRMKTTPQERVLGTVVTRAVVLQNDGGSWKEILRCDEHLENPKGYL